MRSATHLRRRCHTAAELCPVFCRRASSVTVSGYRFLPHRLNEAVPRGAERSHYEHVRFLDDDQSEELVRFLHVDTCLIPRDALQELVKVALPDSGFELVGD